jgi:hypothetical protein
MRAIDKNGETAKILTEVTLSPGFHSPFLRFIFCLSGCGIDLVSPHCCGYVPYQRPVVYRNVMFIGMVSASGVFACPPAPLTFTADVAKKGCPSFQEFSR